MWLTQVGKHRCAFCGEISFGTLSELCFGLVNDRL
jgi:hypothetical protein